MLPRVFVDVLYDKSGDKKNDLLVEQMKINEAISELATTPTYKIAINNSKRNIKVIGYNWTVSCEVALRVSKNLEGYYKNCYFVPKTPSFEVVFDSIEPGLYDVLIMQNDVVQHQQSIQMGKLPKFSATFETDKIVRIQMDACGENDALFLMDNNQIVTIKQLPKGITEFKISLPYHNTDTIFQLKWYRNVEGGMLTKDSPLLYSQLLIK